MIKTIGTAYRRDDFTKDEFFDYWFNESISFNLAGDLSNDLRNDVALNAGCLS